MVRGSIHISPQEPVVKTDVKAHTVDLILDTAAVISMVTCPTGKFIKDTMTFVGSINTI